MSVHEEIREQQKKLKGQGVKAHLQYFWDYYKIHTIVAIAVIIFIGILIKDIKNNKPYAFYGLMLNSNSSSAEEIIEQEFAEYAGIDTTQFSCFVDTSATYNQEIIDEVTLATSQKIMANLSAAELDVIAADKNMFLYYAYQDIYTDLRTLYDDAFLSEHAQDIIYVDKGLIDYIASDSYQDFLLNGQYDESNKYAVMAAEIYNSGEYPEISVEDMQEAIPVGISFEGASILEKTYMYQGQTPVIGIISNTTRLDTAKSFVEYILK
jgi:hypothetical protein